MMNAELKLQLQKDLNITQYMGERVADYECRLIYSAMAEWMRVMVFDQTTDDPSKKSKNYLLRHGRTVLNSFITSSRELQSWFLEDGEGVHEADAPIREIRNRMLASGEYIRIFPSHDITLPMFKRISINAFCERLIGAGGNDYRNIQHVGITRIISTDTSYDNHSWKIEDFMQWISKISKWETVTELDRYVFFNPFSLQPPYKSWGDLPVKNMEIHLARLSLYNGLSEYYLFHKDEKGRWSNTLLPEVLSEGKEERRIILGLRNMCNNPVVAKFDVKGEVGELRLFCRLPIREESYIETFCWPHRYFLDKLSYIVPMVVWPEIKQMLEEQLGMSIEE